MLRHVMHVSMIYVNKDNIDNSRVSYLSYRRIDNKQQICIAQYVIVAVVDYVCPNTLTLQMCTILVHVLHSF